jgi:CysZ protein
LGIVAYKKAVYLIREHKLYWYALIPAFLMLGIYKVGSWLINHQFTIDTTNMNGIIWYLILLMAELSIALLFMKFSKYLVVALLSPLLAHLSQKTEKIITGNRYPFSLKQLSVDIRRGIRIVIRNIMWEYFFFLIILIISLLVWEEVQKSPMFYITFFIGFFYYGFSFLDYVNERRRLSVDESILFIREHRGLAISIGAVYSLLILVPVNLMALFNWDKITDEPIEMLSNFFVHFFLWICAAFAPVLASVASTIAMHDLLDLKGNKWSKNENSKQNSTD